MLIPPGSRPTYGRKRPQDITGLTRTNIIFNFFHLSTFLRLLFFSITYHPQGGHPFTMISKGHRIHCKSGPADFCRAADGKKKHAVPYHVL